MASKYIWGWSPINDFLTGLILTGNDLTNSKLKYEIDVECAKLLVPYLNNPKDVVHLDFQIATDGVNIVVLGNNMISALWLIGIIPDNTNNILNAKQLVVNRNTIINYDKETKLLTISNVE